MDSSAQPPPDPTIRHRLVARGELSPQLPLRVLGLFAQRNLLPDVFVARSQAETLLIELEVSGLDEGPAKVLLEKVRAIVEIDTASLVSVE